MYNRNRLNIQSALLMHYKLGILGICVKLCHSFLA